MKTKTIVAPVGDYMEDLYVGIRDIPTKKVILITPIERQKDAEEAKVSLEKFKIPTTINLVRGFIWEEIFKEIAKIKEFEEEVMINVSTGDRESRCAATSAAFVNGLQAFGIANNSIFMLPVLKFDYYSLISEKKMTILKTVHKEETCCASMDELSKKVKMSLPLISYHINGNLKSEGLKAMGLVETEEKKGKVEVKLSFLGNMLLKGYVN